MRRRAARLFLGIGIAVLGTGLLEKLTLGTWFHSPIAYFQANIIENQNAQFGVEPWYFYLAYVLRCALVFAPIIPYVVIVFLRDARLTLPSLFFLIVHSLVNHKEQRFVWCLAPVVVLIAGRGFQAVWDYVSRYGWRIEIVAVTVVGLVCGEGNVARDLPWNAEPFTSSALALNEVRKVRRPYGSTGLWHVGVGLWQFFYLRRRVPLSVKASGHFEDAERMLNAKAEYNYLITYPNLSSLFDAWHPYENGHAGELVIYRLKW